MTSTYDNLVVIDFVSNVASGEPETDTTATLTEMVYAAVDKNGAGEERRVKIEPWMTLQQAVQQFEAFVFTAFVQPGKRWALVTNGQWALQGCLKRCAAAAEVNLSTTWSKYFDVRREVGKTHRGASLPDLAACMKTMNVQGETGFGSANVMAMCSIVVSLFSAGHVFTSPNNWDPDSTPAAPPGKLALPGRGAVGQAEWATGCGGVLRLRGVPWSAGDEEVQKFFLGYSVEECVISYDHIGKHRGEAYVRFSNDAEAHRAFVEKQGDRMGMRYIELFQSSVKELQDAAASNPGPELSQSLVLRLRGIPFSATDEMIKTFFSSRDISIFPNTIHIQMGNDGRPTGCAFVKVASEDDAVKSLALHQPYMGSRYVELYRASEQELAQVLQQGAMAQSASPAMHGTAGTDHVVKLRGLPFVATELDIANFFSGLNIATQGIHLVYNSDNRPSGEAFVEFQTAQDVNGALAKNGQSLGLRYVEVFRSSKIEMHGGAATPLIAHRASPYPAYGGGKGRSMHPHHQMHMQDYGGYPQDLHHGYMMNRY